MKHATTRGGAGLTDTEADQQLGIIGKRPPPIVRPALAVEVANNLRRMILEGELKAGEKINEKALTEYFGISRTPLREAMKVLAVEGLLDLIPNRGAVISQDTIEDLREGFPVLAALEGVAGELAAQTAGEAEIAEIEAMTRKLRETFQDGDRPHYFQINQAIHNAILAASGNDTLQRTHASLARRIHRARYRANLTRTRWLTALKEHEEIARALRNREAQRLGVLLKQHMMNKLDVLLDEAGNRPE